MTCSTPLIWWRAVPLPRCHAKRSSSLLSLLIGSYDIRHVLWGLEDGEHRHASMHQLGLCSKDSEASDLDKAHGLLRKTSQEPPGTIASRQTQPRSSRAPREFTKSPTHPQSLGGASQSQQLVHRKPGV